MNIYLNIFAVIIIIIIIIILYLIINNTNKEQNPYITTIQTVITDLSKTTPLVDNKIIKITGNNKLLNNLELSKYKHEKFLKNLDNSIEFCLDSNKFLLADYVTQYKILYIELYTLKKNNSQIDLEENEEFLLKTIKLDNLNSIIEKQN